jgi:hypothetical protein
MYWLHEITALTALKILLYLSVFTLYPVLHSRFPRGGVKHNCPSITGEELVAWGTSLMEILKLEGHEGSISHGKMRHRGMEWKNKRKGRKASRLGGVGRQRYTEDGAVEAGKN